MCQFPAVSFGNGLAPGNGFIDVFQLQQAKGCLEFVHLGVDARFFHIGFAPETEVFQVVDTPQDVVKAIKNFYGKKKKKKINA